MRKCNAESQKKAAKDSNFKEDVRALPFLKLLICDQTPHPMQSNISIVCREILKLSYPNVVKPIIKMLKMLRDHKERLQLSSPRS